MLLPKLEVWMSKKPMLFLDFADSDMEGEFDRRAYEEGSKRQKNSPDGESGGRR